MVKMYDIKIKPPKLKSKKLQKRGIHIKIVPPGK